MSRPRALAFIIGTLVLIAGLTLVISALHGAPATQPSPAAPTSASSVAPTTSALDPPDQFLADIHAAGLPTLDNNAAYTQAAAATAPCRVAQEGLPWSDVLALDEQLPVGPSEYGRMAAIGIRDECPRYLSVVPAGWLP